VNEAYVKLVQKERVIHSAVQQGCRKRKSNFYIISASA